MTGNRRPGAAQPASSRTSPSLFRLRSLRNKLAVMFFVIIGSALAVIYFSVVTYPQSNLEEERLRDLDLVAGIYQSQLETLPLREERKGQIARTVRAVAENTESNVTLFYWDESPVGPQGDLRGLQFYARFDSREQSFFPRNDTLLRRAIRGRRDLSGFDSFQGEEIGLVAQPLFGEPSRPGGRKPVTRVALYSRDFEEVAATVSFIRQRVLFATLAALLLALAGGWLVARRLGRRVRRLEVAAEEVSRGHFVDPLPVDSKDELGQLTRTFNEMQVQLRQVEVARKDFIATASHELRTPIFSLAGFVELLQDEDLDDETRREFLETMAEQVARLQKLSVDLLDLSRLDAGSVQLEPEPVDLAELARSVAQEFLPALADHDTDLEFTLPVEGPEAVCDPARVAQIVRILLDNSLRHTPPGTQISVRANRSNGAAALTVADTGPGLPDGSRAKVFERFYTGDAARGAGLGLAIARELAERMDGHLQVSSSNGATAFTLELPAGGNGE
jgi:signal transduction histidine kinase